MTKKNIVSLAAGQEGNFFDNFSKGFHTIFRISAAFLTVSALTYAANGSAVTAGANTWFQGYVQGNKPLFGISGALTIGPASNFSNTSLGSQVANGTANFAVHEFGHTVQFWGHALVTGFLSDGDAAVGWLYGSYILELISKLV